MMDLPSRGKPRRIAIVQGHPDTAGKHYCHALAAAYADGAGAAGHEVRTIDVAAAAFDVLRSQADWQDGNVPPDVKAAQETIGWANHLVIIYPLWLGAMPALLKAFFEQVFRPGFAIDFEAGGRWRRRLKGKSARIVITMGMPATVYRVWFRAHSLKSLERNILAFVGMKPVHATVIGMVEQSDARRKKWLHRLSALGRQAR